MSSRQTKAWVQLKSDQVLEAIRPCLERGGYNVERGKKFVDKIHRPVLFKEMGEHDVQYQIDAYHPDHRVVLEVEAGRGGKGNALYRDIVRMSLMVDADYAAVALPLAYRHRQRSKGQAGSHEVDVPAYDEGRRTMDAIYSSGRLQLPFKGFLVIGY